MTAPPIAAGKFPLVPDDEVEVTSVLNVTHLLCDFLRRQVENDRESVVWVDDDDEVVAVPLEDDDEA